MNAYTITRLSEPQIEPLTLTEMKTALRCYMDITDEDDEIEDLIVSAREWVEGFTARALIDSTFEQSFDDYESGDIILRRSPVLQVISFGSIDSAGIETATAAGSYELRDADSKWPRLVALNGAAWTAGVLRITFRAGYADRTGSPIEGAEKVPKPLTRAMKLWAEAMYERDPATMKLLIEVAERVARPLSAEICAA
jgi:uncharacterized phiE125 gp8 family phage protein